MPLKKDFVISGGMAESKKNYFVSIDNDTFGEAAGSVAYGPDDSLIMTDLDKGTEFLSKTANPTYAELLEVSSMDINPISKSALVAVLLHKLSQKDNVYPWHILKLNGPKDIRTSWTISISDPVSMLEEIKGSKYPILKVKMGFEGDELIADKLRNVPGKVFRVDANGGWTPEKAEKMVHILNRCNINIIEQPTSIDHINDWKNIKGRAKIPLFVDEGLSGLDDYFALADYVDGINVKISKSGGVLNAMSVCRQAGRDKLKIMLGCMIESSIGISQAIYLSSLADYFDLDGPILLKNDLSSDIDYNMEKIAVGKNIIGGPRIHEDYLDS